MRPSTKNPRRASYRRWLACSGAVNLSVDSVVFEHALPLLVDTMGPSQVMVGSDYPYPFGERPAGRLVCTATFLNEQDRAAIRSGNALRFLGLDQAVRPSSPENASPRNMMTARADTGCPIRRRLRQHSS